MHRSVAADLINNNVSDVLLTFLHSMSIEMGDICSFANSISWFTGCDIQNKSCKKSSKHEGKHYVWYTIVSTWYPHSRTTSSIPLVKNNLLHRGVVSLSFHAISKYFLYLPSEVVGLTKLRKLAFCRICKNIEIVISVACNSTLLSKIGYRLRQHEEMAKYIRIKLSKTKKKLRKTNRKRRPF